MRTRLPVLLLFAAGFYLSGCALQLNLGSSSDSSSGANQLTYDGAISLTIKTGQTLAGTDLSYQGKTPDGRALVSIGGQQEAKSTADSVNFSGSPQPGTLLSLSTRVGPYDSNSVTLVGTVHVSVKDAQPQPGNPALNQITAFSIPVTYNVNKNAVIPGSTIVYLGQASEGAQFGNTGGFPYRQNFDSVVWIGHLRDKIGLRLDLRVINYNADAVTLVGLANVRFEQ